MQHQNPSMRGFITEQHFEQAEAEFPGIRALFETCIEKPRTFIELLAQYLTLRTKACSRQAAAA